MVVPLGWYPSCWIPQGSLPAPWTEAIPKNERIVSQARVFRWRAVKLRECTGFIFVEAGNLFIIGKFAQANIRPANMPWWLRRGLPERTVGMPDPVERFWFRSWKWFCKELNTDVFPERGGNYGQFTLLRVDSFTYGEFGSQIAIVTRNWMKLVK